MARRHEPSRDLSRRALLAATAAGSALAGCGSGGGERPATVRSPRCPGTADPAPPDTSADGWPQPGHDAGLTSATADAGPTPPLESHWRVDRAALDGWTRDHPLETRAATETPVVADGTALLASTSGVHAVDAATGEHRWTVREKLVRPAGLLLADDTLVALGRSSTAPTPDRVVGVDLATRSVAWRRAAPDVESVGPYDGRWVYVQTEEGPRRLDPASGEFGGDVITIGGDSLGSVAVARDGTAYAVDDWSVRAVDEAGETSLSIEVDGPAVPAGWYDVPATALAGDTLFLAWPYAPRVNPNVPGGGTTVADPPAHDRDGVVVALDAATGERRWIYCVDGAVTLGLAAGAETLYLCGYTHRLTGTEGRARGFVEAVDAGSGCRLWHTQTSSGELPEHAPTLAGGRLSVVTSGDRGPDALPGPAQTGSGGAVRVLDARTGTRLGGRSLSGVAWRSEPVVADGRVYLATQPVDSSERIVGAVGSASG